MRQKHLLFDLDGTIIASDEGITKSVQYALSHFGILVDDLSVLKPFVGPPLRVAFPKYYNLNPEQTEEAVRLYRSRYSEIGIFECSVYEGVEHMLKTCREKGYISLLATSKPHVYARRILEKFGLSEYFYDVAGCELDGRMDKKSEVIDYARSLFPDAEKSDFMMIGDRFYDVDGAKECGIECVGVLYGYGTREELEKAGAEYICETVKDLENLLIK